jgi:hypothetical protein
VQQMLQQTIFIFKKLLTRAVFQGVRREKLLQRFDAFVYRAVDRGGKEAALESADTATDKS